MCRNYHVPSALLKTHYETCKRWKEALEEGTGRRHWKKELGAKVEPLKVHLAMRRNATAPPSRKPERNREASNERVNGMSIDAALAQLHSAPCLLDGIKAAVHHGHSSRRKGEIAGDSSSVWYVGVIHAIPMFRSRASNRFVSAEAVRRLHRANLKLSIALAKLGYSALVGTEVEKNEGKRGALTRIQNCNRSTEYARRFSSNALSRTCMYCKLHTCTPTAHVLALFTSTPDHNQPCVFVGSRKDMEPGGFDFYLHTLRGQSAGVSVPKQHSDGEQSLAQVQNRPLRTYLRVRAPPSRRHGSLTVHPQATAVTWNLHQGCKQVTFQPFQPARDWMLTGTGTAMRLVAESSTGTSSHDAALLVPTADGSAGGWTLARCLRHIKPKAHMYCRAGQHSDEWRHDEDPYRALLRTLRICFERAWMGRRLGERAVAVLVHVLVRQVRSYEDVQVLIQYTCTFVQSPQGVKDTGLAMTGIHLYGLTRHLAMAERCLGRGGAPCVRPDGDGTCSTGQCRSSVGVVVGVVYESVRVGTSRYESVRVGTSRYESSWVLVVVGIVVGIVHSSRRPPTPILWRPSIRSVSPAYEFESQVLGSFVVVEPYGSVVRHS
ncbi:hypothetical protein RJ55_08048 [Drechmeria coniospora]|nr:hypothetical protein RJ55_08048 [Drechmeria coniospora]